VSTPVAVTPLIVVDSDMSGDESDDDVATDCEVVGRSVADGVRVVVAVFPIREQFIHLALGPSPLAARFCKYSTTFRLHTFGCKYVVLRYVTGEPLVNAFPPNTFVTAALPHSNCLSVSVA
jgi:hypothetical protein